MLFVSLEFVSFHVIINGTHVCLCMFMRQKVTDM